MFDKEFTAAAAFGAALLLSLSAQAAGPHGAGLTVVKDPTTGKLRAPTPEESAALEAAAPAAAQSRSAGKRGMTSGRVNPGQVRHADGAVEQELDESTMSYSVVRRNRDGSLSNYCVEGSKAAQALLKDGKPVSRVSKSKESGLELK